MFESSKKRQFLVIKFEDFLTPLYIKLHPMEIDGGISTSYDDSRRVTTLKFVTGVFDYKQNDSFEVTECYKNKFGQVHVTLEFHDEKAEWWRFEYIDENAANVVWSRKYFSEVHGIKYERE